MQVPPQLGFNRTAWYLAARARLEHGAGAGAALACMLSVGAQERCRSLHVAQPAKEVAATT